MNIESYRPVSILPSVTLIFERVLYNEKKWFIHRKRCKNQHGFRKNNSTVKNLILNCDAVYKKPEQRELPHMLF